MKYLICALLLLMGAATGVRADDTAMLFFVKGRVEVKEGNADWKSAPVLRRLNAGDQVRPAPGAEAGIVLLASGERFAVSGGATATVSRTAISGARSLGRPAGLSASAAAKLAGGRTGAFVARELVGPFDLAYQFDGWFPVGTRKFSWSDERLVPKSMAYSFAILDRSGAVLWSAYSTTPGAVMQPNVPNFAARVPYVWRLTRVNAMGQTARSFWGVVTFLDPHDAAAMKAQASQLREMYAQAKNSAKSGAVSDISTPDTELYAGLIIDNYLQYGDWMAAYDFAATEVLAPQVEALIDLGGPMVQAFQGVSRGGDIK